MRVFVYFNLHRKVWSVKALDGAAKGRVVAHASHVALCDAVCRVSEAGRQRVIREQRKNVHAGIVGTLRGIRGVYTPAVIEAAGTDGFRACPPILSDTDREATERAAQGHDGAQPITYNPYKAGTFVRRSDDAPVRRAASVLLAGRSVGAFL